MISEMSAFTLGLPCK